MTSYLHVLMKAQALGLIRPGEVAQVEVAHDTGGRHRWRGLRLVADPASEYLRASGG